MSEIDLYEVGAKLLGDEPAEGALDATAIRLGQLQDILDQVYAALPRSRGPTQGAATTTTDRVTVSNRVNETAGAPRQVRLARPMSGMADQEAAGAVVPSPRPDPALSFGLTPAAALTIIQGAYAPTGNPRASVPMTQDLASAEKLERGRASAEMQADRITAPEFAGLLAKAGPDGARDGQALPAAFSRSGDRLSKKPGGSEGFHTFIPASRVELPQDLFPWRAAGIAPGARTRAPFRQTAAGGVRDTDSFARAGALIGQADGAQSPRILPTKMWREDSKGGGSGAGVGAMIEDTWRRIQKPGGKAEAAAGDAAYLGAAGGSGAASSGVIGAIVTATLAAAQTLALRDQPTGRDPSLPGGVPAPGATPDRPLYTRIVIDQSPIPTMVTNHDALTSATVNMLAQHQGAMPTAPTGLNNSLVPPAPGIPAPGSYHP